MGGVNFSLESAQRIVAAVKRVEAQSKDMSGAPNPSRPYGSSFYAMITGASDIGGTFFDWVAVQPAMSTMAVAQPSTLIAASNLWTFQQPYVAGMGNAREANDSRDIPAGTVVLLTFVGYAVAPDSGDGVFAGTITTEGGSTADVAGSDNSIPFYVFQYNTQSNLDGVVPLHDHRDNITGGGFAFSVYHPGTSLPQQNWSL